MKKNKGFTLLELLAVILIIAIVALVTIPQVLKIINESRENSAMDSMYGYIKAIEQSYVKNTINPDETEEYKGEYTEISELSIAKTDAQGGQSLEIDLKGSKPNLDAENKDYVKLDKYGRVEEALIKFSHYYVSYCGETIINVNKKDFVSCSN